MQFNIESWPWKFAVVAGLLGMRAFVHLLSPREKNSGESGETSKWLLETIDSAAIAIGLVLFVIQPFILQAFFIPSGSMENTLRIGDRLLVSKLVYRLKEPAFEDVVVFKAPPDALVGSGSPEGTDFIKRCMGEAGDVVYVINRQVFRGRDGAKPEKVKDQYVKWSEEGGATFGGAAPDELPGAARKSYDMKIVGGAVYSRDYFNGEPGEWSKNNVRQPDQDAITRAKPGAIPADSFLMLGDHRSDSNDGHVWGFVPRGNIVGKAICVFWPPTRLGLVDNMSKYPRKP